MSSLGILTAKPNFEIPSFRASQNLNGFRYKNPPPEELLPVYRKAISENGEWYFDYASFFHNAFPTANYSADNFLKFFKENYGIGYVVHCYRTESATDPIGRWHWSNDQSVVHIYVAEHLSLQVQKTTVIHECLHVIQELDIPFTLEVLKYPPELHTQIVERITNKAMAEVVLPRAEYQQCLRRGWTNAKIADHYNVSMGLVNCYKKN
jgi:hypothetical protein